MRVALIDKTSKIVVNTIEALEDYENYEYLVIPSETAEIGNIYNEDTKVFEEVITPQERISEILQELNEIDRKSIRALRANEADYIAIYEQQAQALREELQQLQQAEESVEE